MSNKRTAKSVVEDEFLDAHIMRDFVTDWWDRYERKFTCTCEVGITGGCALKMYRACYPPKKCYPGEFQMGDLDLVFAGNNDADYLHGVSSFCTYSLSNTDYFTVSKEVERDDIIPGESVRITNFGIWREYAEYTVSFIHYPTKTNKLIDVIRTYDIDIVQLAYNLKTRSFELGQGIRTANAIMNSEARVVRDFVFSSEPTETEISSLSSTLNRTLKYKKRGFLFKTKPVISFEPV